MIPDGWISQREAANTQHLPGLVENNTEEKEINKQREASNNHQDSGSVEGPTTNSSSQRYLQLFSLVLSWKGLGISLLATIFGVISLQLYVICLSFLCLKQPKVWFLPLLQQTGTDRNRHGQEGTDGDRQEQTVTYGGRQGQAGTDRDRKGLSLLIFEKAEIKQEQSQQRLYRDKTGTRRDNSAEKKTGTNQAGT